MFTFFLYSENVIIQYYTSSHFESLKRKIYLRTFILSVYYYALNILIYHILIY